MGIKDASGDQAFIEGIIESVLPERPEFVIWGGDDPQTLPLLALGAHGVVSVVSNLIPEEMMALVRAGLEGDFVEARRWHYRLLPIFRAASVEINPISIKAMMHLAGHAAGPCRLPLVGASVDTLEDAMRSTYCEAQSEY